MAPKKTVICQAVFLLLLIGFAAWMFSIFGEFSSNVACIIDSIKTLKTVKGEVGKGLTSFTSAIPDSLIAQLEQFVGLLAVFVILPAVGIIFFQTILVVCALKNKKGDTAKCIKCLVCILTQFCILGVVFYIIVGGIGIVSSTAEGQAAQAAITDVCTTTIPQTRADLTDSQALVDQLKAAGGSGPTVDEAQFELDEADKAVTALEKACGCFAGLAETFTALTAPGFACAVVCLILLILNCCTCCALGCCGKPKGVPQGNAAVDKVGV